MNNNSANDPILDFDNQLTNAIKESLAKIGVALNRINANIEEYSQNKDTETALEKLDELYNGNTDIYDWADSFSEQEKSVLLILYYTGSRIPYSTLPNDTIKRRNDVIQIAQDYTCDWFALDAAKSDTKDDCFRNYITCGGTPSKKNIELSLSELGIPFQKA